MPRKSRKQTVAEGVRKLNLRTPEPEPEADEPYSPPRLGRLQPMIYPDSNGMAAPNPEDEAEAQLGMFPGAPPPVPVPEFPSVAPETASSQRSRFESPVREDVLVTSHETMENLSQFFGNLPDRERFDVAVWRCDPQSPQNQRKRAWKGRVPLPTSYTLEEGIDREFGGGVYYWRLGFEGRHASRSDLPADYQALPMAGYIRLETAAKGEEAAPVGVDPLLEARLQKAEGAQSELLGFLKEMVRDKKDTASKDSDAMTKLMTVVLAANQSQMQAMQQQAANQQQFLLAMLTMTEKKASEAREQKDSMMQLMMEAVRGETSGDKPMATTLIENLPRILEGLAKVPGLAQPSPRVAPPVQALPPAPPQPIQTKAPVPVVVAPPAAAPVAEDYPTAIARRCIAGWQGREPADKCADAIEELGTDENFNDLLDTDQAQVIAFLAVGFKAANNIEAPDELKQYARAVLAELHERYPDNAPEPMAPAGPVPQPVPVPAPAPAVQVPNAPAQGQAAG